MTRKMGVLLIGFLFSALASFSGVADTDAKPPFFEVTVNGKTTYLLGSVHVGRAQMYPLPSAVEAKLKSAEAIVLEVLIENADLPTLMQNYGMGKPQLPDDVAQKRQRFCEDYVRECASIDVLQPWMQASMITMLRFGELGLTPEYGVESYISNRYAQLPRYELESTELQFKMFSSLSAELQLLMLKDALEAQPAELSELLDAWGGGDPAALTELVKAGFGDNPELFEKIIVERNRDMVSALLQLLTSAKQNKLFVVVGAAHLVGPDSMPQMLSEKGAKVVDCFAQTCGVSW
ncbi:TraB/GumN family protein [Paraferrimonas sedimenticola]|uniref:Protein GumN n=1 Tax=Paraferrimonas sedimenticola TaxID=375674 RepID=A0AA37RYI3_9GAMM|nr:TraB/GumN family protein [Paraferrimonas sedimenticola]GLP97289.1 protein GumN [Paraferrimonas sedimenticola]